MINKEVNEMMNKEDNERKRINKEDNERKRQEKEDNERMNKCNEFMMNKDNEMNRFIN